MESLPDDVLLHILSRLYDSADVARCRVASKAFDSVFPGLRSINLECTWKWYVVSNPRWILTPNNEIKPFKTVFVDLISKMEAVESVSISLEDQSIDLFESLKDDFCLTDDAFCNHWLPMVSGSLKSLAISDRHSQRSTNVLLLISKHCHHLVNLSLERTCLSTHDMNLMPTLRTLVLTNVSLKDQELNELNNCLPNLQVLSLVGIQGLKNPVIHHLHLKTCVWKGTVFHDVLSLTLITSNLVTLTIKCLSRFELHIEAPMLSQFSLVTIKNSFLKEFPVTKTVKTLTLDSQYSRSKLNLGKVFTVFPNLTCLYIRSGAWLDFESWLNTRGCEVLDTAKGLKTICAYLKLADPLLTFSSVAFVLDQCVGLSKVSFLIHSKVVGTVCENFVSKCMTRWPGLKWRWGIWSEDKKDSWITYDGSSSKKLLR